MIVDEIPRSLDERGSLIIRQLAGKDGENNGGWLHCHSGSFTMSFIIVSDAIDITYQLDSLKNVQSNRHNITEQEQTNKIIILSIEALINEKRKKTDCV